MQAMLSHGLAIACFALFFFTTGGLMDYVAIGIGFAALAIAASKRDEPPAWAATHHEFALRSMLIGGSLWMVASVIGIVPILGWTIAWGIKICVLGWLGIRSVVGMLRARDRLPMARPRSLML